MRKIEILDKEQQKLFDCPMIATTEEQKNYFTLPDAMKIWASSIATPTNFVGFILLFGYLRFSGKFYKKEMFAKPDIDFVCQQNNLSATKFKINKYNQRTYNYHKQIIRGYLEIKPFNKESLALLTNGVKDRIARNLSAIETLYEVAYWLKAQKIEVPSYNRFVSVISSELGRFELIYVTLYKIVLHRNKNINLNV